nr:hypothetical protein [Tanacetum cinerariifolium]
MSNQSEDIQAIGSDTRPPMLDRTDLESWKQQIRLYCPKRDRVVADLSQAKKERLRADIRAMNILLRGMPIDIYKLINHNTDAKDIWDNVNMLLEELSGEFVASLFGEVLREGASLSIKVEEEEDTPAIFGGVRVIAEMRLDATLGFLKYSSNIG